MLPGILLSDFASSCVICACFQLFFDNISAQHPYFHNFVQPVNRELVELWRLVNRLSWALWVSCESESLWDFEVNGGSDVLLDMLVGSGFDSSGSGFGFLTGHF